MTAEVESTQWYVAVRLFVDESKTVYYIPVEQVQKFVMPPDLTKPYYVTVNSDPVTGEPVYEPAQILEVAGENKIDYSHKHTNIERPIQKFMSLQIASQNWKIRIWIGNGINFERCDAVML